MFEILLFILIHRWNSIHHFILLISMKILFVLDLYKPHIWWVEILFENIINRLIEKWHEVKVLTSRYDKNLPEYEKEKETWIEIYRIWGSRYRFMIACLRKGIQLAKWADIIHGTTYNSAIPASLIWKFSKKKVVLTCHEIFGQLWYRFMGWKGFFFKMFELLIFKFHYDKIICVSNYTKNCLRIHFWVKDDTLITIYNWVDYHWWDRKNFPESEIKAIREQYHLQENYVWIFFGRPGISKGLLYFVKAIPEIVKNIPTFKALLNVSESVNNKADEVRKFIKENKLEDYIVWIWWVKYKELWNYILAADVAVVPSLVEWFWFSAAETCAIEQQLICSNVAALTEVVSGKINFAEPWNPHAIAEAMINFYHWKYQEIPRKEFLWEENINQTLDCYLSEK